MSADDSSFGPAVCRVCLCGESSIPYMGTTGGEPLISPCHCKGSMGLYHKSCLEHWLYTSRTTHCEICNFRFQYGTKNQTICAYFRLRGWNDKGMRSLPGDLFSISTFTPVAALMIYLCIKSSHENLTNSPESGVTGEIFVMLALAFIIASVIFFWYILTLCFHYQQFRLWQAHHKLVFIIDQLEYSRRSEKGSFMSKLVSMFCCCVHDENSRHHVPLSDVNINPNMISPGGSLHASDSPGSSSSSSSNSPLINNIRGHVETTRSSTGFPLATFRPNGAAPDCISSLPLLYRDEPRIYDIPPDATNFSDIDLGTPLQTSPRPTGTPPLFPSPLLTLTETFV